MSTEGSGAPIRASAEATPRWLTVLLGLGSIVVGILLIVLPRKSLFLLAWLGGLAVVAWGVRQGAEALRSDDPPSRVGGLFVAIASIGAGLTVVIVPDVSLRLLRILIGVTAVIWGLVDAAEAFLRPGGRWWAFLLRGAGTFGLGLALLLAPEPTVWLVGVLIGALLIVRGVAELVAPRVVRRRVRIRGTPPA